MSRLGHYRIAHIRLFKSNKLRKALLGYMSCVYDLMPWSASPILLTAEQCYQSGLAQL